jgi:hypothetical protein
MVAPLPRALGAVVDISLKKVFAFTRRRVPVTYVPKILIIVVRFFAVNDVIMMSSCQRQKHASIGIRIDKNLLKTKENTANEPVNLIITFTMNQQQCVDLLSYYIEMEHTSVEPL